MKPAPLKLPGTHRVRKQLADGRVAFYWYRFRGGDLLMKFEGANLKAALAAEASGAAALAAAYGKQPSRPEVVGLTVAALITRYKLAPTGFERLAPKTKANWRKSLDLIHEKFGRMPLQALGAKGAKKLFVAWRDGFQHTPRQADNHMTVLKRLFSWAVEVGEIEKSPVEGVPGIYRNDRASLIVEAHELAAILAKVTPVAARAIGLAAALGLRREDIISIKWADVHKNFIRFETGKSRGKKRVVVPLLGDAATIIEEARQHRKEIIAKGRVPPANVLLTQKGTAWRPDSLTQSFARAAATLGIDRTLNDLRGTAITRFAVAGFTNEQIADIVGWEVNRVSNIRKHYVDPSIVSEKLIDQLEWSHRTG